VNDDQLEKQKEYWKAVGQDKTKDNKTVVHLVLTSNVKREEILVAK
jgi:hypothetical protein